MANDTFQLIVGGILANQPVENVLHFDLGAMGADPITNAISLNAAWAADVESDWLDCLPDNYVYLGTKAKQVNNGGGPTSGALAAPGTTGNRGSNADTSAIGPVLIVPYQPGGVWRTGRIFMPGVGESDISDNVFVAALLAALGVLSGTLVAPITAGGADPSFSYGVWKSSTDEFFNATAIGVSTKPGLQNRRLKPVF